MPLATYLNSLPADDALIASALSGSAALVAFALAMMGICALGSIAFGFRVAPKAGV